MGNFQYYVLVTHVETDLKLLKFPLVPPKNNKKGNFVHELLRPFFTELRPCLIPWHSSHFKVAFLPNQFLLGTKACMHGCIHNTVFLSSAKILPLLTNHNGPEKDTDQSDCGSKKSTGMHPNKTDSAATIGHMPYRKAKCLVMTFLPSREWMQI